MESIDPATGRPLPADAIQRILFIANSVHVYNIPPMATLQGHAAATWTQDPKRHIFTCRLRVVETSVPDHATGQDTVKADVVLEDPSTGQLFAAAPYTDPAAVEAALDSSRFFALRVQDGSGRKATLGIGFEDRADAFDFGVGLQEAQKALGLGPAPAGASGKPPGADKEAKAEEKRDYSLKEGETITVNFGGSKLGRKGARPLSLQPEQLSSGGESANLSSFALPPPPSSNAPRRSSLLASPATAQAVKFQQQQQQQQQPAGFGAEASRKSAQDLGFDDGQNGEFA